MLLPLAAALALVVTLMLPSASAKDHQGGRMDQQSRLTVRPRWARRLSLPDRARGRGVSGLRAALLWRVPSRGTLLPPAFNTFLAIGVRTLGVHDQWQRNPRPGAAISTALMWQASAPDQEIARPSRNLDDVIAGNSVPAAANAPGSLMLFQVVSILPSDRWTRAI
jgi:hypothetical protein